MGSPGRRSEMDLVFRTAGCRSELRGVAEGTLVSLNIPAAQRRLEPAAFQFTHVLTTVVIPCVDFVGPQAFMGCAGLRRVCIIDRCTRIYESAFEGCCSLTEVTLPNCVADIRSRAFAECASLEAISLPPSLPVIADEVFAGCTRLATVQVPPGIFLIDNGAFARCTSLSHIDLPPTTETIHEKAFQGCTALATALIAAQHCTFSPRAFDGCRSLQCVIAPALIGDSAGVFACTPLPVFGGVVDDTAVARARVAAIQAALRYWSWRRHQSCLPDQRAWVVAVMLVAGRLSDRGLHLPEEMWLAILGFLRRTDLGCTRVRGW